MTPNVPGKALKVYNTLGHEIQVFAPLDSDRVRMYTCGPTVYSYAHIGNLRAYVFADTLKRALLWKGYSVDQIINVTDVGHLVADSDTGDDKVELAATKERRSVWELTKFYADAAKHDLERVGVIPPICWTVASDYVPAMIAFAEELERKGFAYRIESGLWFDTSRQSDYGALVNMKLEGAREGARVDPTPGKRNPADFAVWRTFSDGKKRLMEWNSPWGVGVPGWHLECSVMSIDKLGAHFDIHTGGADNRSPHHVNEIAQSEAFLDDGRPWVKYWLHNDFLVDTRGEKLSKSKGHGIPTLQDLVDDGLSPFAFRWWLIGSLYRKPLSLDIGEMKNASTSLDRIASRVVTRLGDVASQPVETFEQARMLVKSEQGKRIIEELDAAVSGDLNTPKVVAVAATVSQDESVQSDDLAIVFDAIRSLTAIDVRVVHERRESSSVVDESSELYAEVTLLVEQRTAARASGDWQRADEIRDELAAKGVVLADSASGTDWSFVNGKRQ